MKNIVHLAVAGAMAAALMALLKLVLSQQPALALHHYPAFNLVGQDGFRSLGRMVLLGAVYGVAYGLLLKDLLPGGFVVRALSLAAVPTLVDALVLPLRAGLPAVRDPWALLWLYADWTFFSVCLMFLAGGKGSKGGGKPKDE